MIRAPALSSALAGVFLLAGSPASAQVVTCAAEGGICRVPAAASVYFGVPGRTASIAASGPVACNVQTFGRDPAPGAKKGCSYVLDGGRGGGSGAGFENNRRGRGGDDGFDRRRADRDRDFDERPRRSRREFDDGFEEGPRRGPPRF